LYTSILFLHQNHLKFEDTKDQLGDQRGGSEWEPIKILLLSENSAYTPNSQPRIPTRVCQGHVVTTDLPTLGTNPKQSRSESTNQETKDLVILRAPFRTVRDPRADGPRSPGGRSVNHNRTTRRALKHADGPKATGAVQTVRDVQAYGPSHTPTVRDPYADCPTNPFRPETDDQTNRNENAQEHPTNTKNPRPKGSARTVHGL
jgi:hypothetical protein